MTVRATFGTELPDLALTADGLHLRPFASSDLPLIEEASADAMIPTITTVPPTFSVEAGGAFIERQLQRRVDGEGWSLAIGDVDNKRPVGQIGLWISNLHKGRAELGYWVVPSCRGNRIAGRALTLLSDWALENLDVSRLSLFIEPWNSASIRTAEWAEYEKEGLLRGWERVGGVAKDMLSFVRLAPDEGKRG